MSYTTKTHTTTYPSLTTSLPSHNTVLITGGGTGIGAATAHSFARSGTRHLILLGRRPEPLSTTTASIRSAHPDTKVTTHAMDILSASDLDRIFTESGRVDVVVHAAAVLPPLTPLADPDLDVEKLWHAFEINILGTLNVARALINSPSQGDGQAVFVSLSTAGTLMPPLPGMGGYVASKLPALKMMEYLGSENRDRLRVVSVHPGLIRTDAAVEIEKTGLVFPYEDGMFIPAFFTSVRDDADMGVVSLTAASLFGLLVRTPLFWPASLSLRIGILTS
jgi:NAD(P)-dependent dehydrogenase (short-subunit alcohol dehydrogenase family)